MPGLFKKGSLPQGVDLLINTADKAPETGEEAKGMVQSNKISEELDEHIRLDGDVCSKLGKGGHFWDLSKESQFEITPREVIFEISPREVTFEITPREVTFEITLRVAGTTVAQTLMLSPASRTETCLYIQKDDN